MSKSRKRSTKAGKRLAKELRGAYKRAVRGGAMRRRILENFVGWAYANGHAIPKTREELDAMICVFEMFLREGITEQWHDDYRRMNADRQNKRRLACQWWTVCKTLSRQLPMQHERPKHLGIDMMYRYP